MSQNQWIYLVVVLFGGALLIWGLLKTIARFKRRRISRLGDIEDINPVSTVAPPGVTDNSTLAQAADNIQGRFSIIRRAVIVAGALLLLPLLIIPFSSYLPLTSISVLISALGIIIGIAARPIIENFIAGVLMSFSSSIRLGDTVIVDGYYGVIEDITLLHTSIKTWDWKRYVISNSDMLNREMVNFTMKDNFIWAHVEFHVATDADLQQVRDCALRIAGQYSSAKIKEGPRFWVMEMGPTSIKCWVAAWAESAADAWNLQHNVRTELVIELSANGIPTQLNRHVMQKAYSEASNG